MTTLLDEIEAALQKTTSGTCTRRQLAEAIAAVVERRAGEREHFDERTGRPR
jgi:hypothetical protein